MDYTIKVLAIEHVTHNVKMFRCEKPPGYQFVPGQATEVSINKDGWRDEKRPFTFTALTDAPFLEFVIKIYNDHSGVTNELNTLKPGDELLIGDAWGAIEYKGPGYFIAGGAGITPFIAILRYLNTNNLIDGNKLLFSNRTHLDIILRDELSSMLKENAIYTVTDEPSSDYHNGFIDEAFLKQHIDDSRKHFYVCGPPQMISTIQDILSKLGVSADEVVFEK